MTSSLNSDTETPARLMVSLLDRAPSSWAPLALPFENGESSGHPQPVALSSEYFTAPRILTTCVPKPQLRSFARRSFAGQIRAFISSVIVKPQVDSAGQNT